MQLGVGVNCDVRVGEGKEIHLSDGLDERMYSYRTGSRRVQSFFFSRKNRTCETDAPRTSRRKYTVLWHSMSMELHTASPPPLRRVCHLLALNFHRNKRTLSRSFIVGVGEYLRRKSP